jgi:TonB-dependent SusC/RagA subfamily outer membrane receptor
VNDVNLDDINDITVLQGPNAAALFGPDGANGAIVISTKKARRNYDIPRWSEYAYSSTEDVEYMNIIKKTGASEKFAVYEELENDNKKSPGFYFDIFQFGICNRSNEYFV